ncbi:MAG: InlB B-repeat-containing protein [Candidatus Izemoplasmatales bacterium]|nr:InlB B-repeat-containing protein [Candidatus Izemoplasmatales bacterium]
MCGTIDYAIAYKQGSTTLWTPFVSHELFIDMTHFFNLAEGEEILFMNRGIIHTNFGRVYAWGTEFTGKILDGAQRPSPVDLASRLELLEDETIVDISVRTSWDMNKIHVLTSTGRVLSLVHFTVDANYDRAYNALVEDLTPNYTLEEGEMIIDIDFYQQNYVLTNLGKVYAHGSSSSSFYLGSNDLYSYATPIDISLLVNLEGSKFQKLFITDRNGFLWTDDGRIYAFGANTNRSLGNGTTDPVLAPKEMTFHGSIFNQSYDFADFIGLPEPAQIGKVFHGYFLDSHFSSPFNPENLPLGLISLYPKWETLYYEFAYVTMGGLTINMDHYHYHERIEELKTPIRFGYTFAGWYLDDQLTQPFDYQRMPACGVTLYAKWSINDYAIELYDRESPTFEKIYTGEYRTIGITTSGKILMWGDRYGTENQDYFDFYEPIDITDMFDLEPGETIVDCSVSFDHMVFLSSLGNVYAFGYNHYGQTAGRSGKITDLLSLDSGDQIVKIQTAAYVTYVLSESGNLYAFGAQYLGRLGTGSPSHLTTPTNITSHFPLEADETIIDIFASYTHTLALTSNGRLFFCGGETVVSGSGVFEHIETLSRDIPMDITSRLNLQPGEQPLSLSSGDFFTIVLTTYHRVLTLGYGPDGELGSDSIYNGNAVDITALFSFLPGETPIEIASGDNHTLLKTSLGRAFSWGLGIMGSTGSGSVGNRTTPYNLSRQLNLLQGESVKEISAGAFASFIITTYGRTLAFGDNLLNELGFSKHESTPLDVTDVFPALEKGEYYIDIATGMYHGIALTNLGKVFTWGDSSWGQGGSNIIVPSYPFVSDSSAFSSREITSRFNLNPGEKVIAIEAGALFSSALTSSGRFFTWGNNSQGELGLSVFSYEYLALPRDITSRFGLEAGEVIVDFKSAHTITYVRTSLGKTYYFGATQTSIIDAPMRVNPISPEPDGQITDLAMSPWTYFFRTSDGQLFGGGHNLYGTLGNTTNFGKNLGIHSLDFPILLDEETILKVYSGNYSTLIQTSMGRIFTFGLNQCGQLGLGTSSPVVTEPIEITDSLNLDPEDEITDVVFGGRINFDNGGFMVIATKMGKVFVSGSNDRNTLLLDGSKQSSILIDVTHKFAFAPGDYIVQLEASESSVLARTFMGRMLAWGARDKHDFDMLKEIGYTPMDVGALPLETGDDIIEVVAGMAGSAAVTQDGRLLYAGTNSYGLADPTNPDWIRRFTDITDHYGLHQDEKVLKLALGNAFIVIYTSEGRVLTSGRYYAFDESDPINMEGTIDLSSYITLDPDDEIIEVMANYRTAAIRTLKGRIFMWGANDGRYGNGTVASSSVPLEIDYASILLPEETIEKIALGYDHTLILTSQHRVLSTGKNAGYQLGDGTSIDTNVPIDITSRFDYLNDEFIIDIHGGYRYSVALSSEDRLFEWGTRGNYNPNINQSKPALVPDFLTLLGTDSITSYRFGGAHGFVSTNSGKVIAFGHNTMNQIGYVNNADSKAVDVTNQFRLREGESLRFVVAGFQHSIALTSDNRLLTWGNNENSELGNGFAAVYPAPVPIDITIYVKIASEYITYGSLISELPTPEKDGHTFLYWAYDKEGLLPLNALTMPANDIRVYAIWETNTYQITLDVLGETTVLDPLEYGSVIRLRDPFLESGTFAGWFLDSEWSIPLSDYFMPAEHLTLYAKVDLP